MDEILKKYTELSIQDKGDINNKCFTYSFVPNAIMLPRYLDTSRNWLDWGDKNDYLLNISIDKFIEDNRNNILFYSLFKTTYKGIYINNELGICFGFVIDTTELEENPINFCLSDIDNLPNLMDFIRTNCKIKSPKKESKINLLQYTDRDGYYLKESSFNPIKDLNIEENYNNDFKDVNKSLVDNIITKKNTFSILHGVPGTGKTTYIKHLCSKLNDLDKEIVYLPPNVTTILSSPSFINSLELFKDKVVIIEDAEEVLVDSGKRSQAISNILNITDGILADIYNIHFIFTFNTDIRKIDPALLRKGRLTLKYEFKELESSKVTHLCKKLNVDCSTNKTLAEIYNSEDNLVQKDSKSIGFSLLN